MAPAAETRYVGRTRVNVDDELADLIANATSVAVVSDAALLPRETAAVLVASLDDSIVEALLPLEALRALVQSGNSSITDAGLLSLGRLAALEVLDLEWSASITGKGLESLTKLSNLRWVDLSFCPGITADDVRGLQRALPKCEIEFYGG
jgi:hypothetical protein